MPATQLHHSHQSPDGASPLGLKLRGQHSPRPAVGEGQAWGRALSPLQRDPPLFPRPEVLPEAFRTAQGFQALPLKGATQGDTHLHGLGSQCASWDPMFTEDRSVHLFFLRIHGKMELGTAG